MSSSLGTYSLFGIQESADVAALQHSRAYAEFMKREREFEHERKFEAEYDKEFITKPSLETVREQVQVLINTDPSISDFKSLLLEVNNPWDQREIMLKLFEQNGFNDDYIMRPTVKFNTIVWEYYFRLTPIAETLGYTKARALLQENGALHGHKTYTLEDLDTIPEEVIKMQANIKNNKMRLLSQNMVINNVDMRPIIPNHLRAQRIAKSTYVSYESLLELIYASKHQEKFRDTAEKFLKAIMFANDLASTLIPKLCNYIDMLYRKHMEMVINNMLINREFNARELRTGLAELKEKSAAVEYACKQLNMSYDEITARGMLYVKAKERGTITDPISGKTYYMKKEKPEESDDE